MCCTGKLDTLHIFQKNIEYLLNHYRICSLFGTHCSVVVLAMLINCLFHLLLDMLQLANLSLEMSAGNISFTELIRYFLF